MKEKIYFWLTILNSLLFSFVLCCYLWDNLNNIIWLWFWIIISSILFILILYSFWKTWRWTIIYNILIWLLTPFIFEYHQSLSSIILIIFFSLPLFIFPDNKEKWWLKISYYIFFSILFILSIWNSFLVHNISTAQLIMSYIINLSFLFVLIFGNWKFIKKNILFYIIHLSIFLYCFVLYKEFLFPFKWFEGWGMIPVFVFSYYTTLFCYITIIWNIIFFLLEKKNEELKQ